MLRSYWQNPFIKFIFLGSVLFIGWLLMYEYYIRDYTLLDEYIIQNLVYFSSAGLSILGYTTITEDPGSIMRVVGIDGTHGVWIGDPCDGLELFALFLSFMLAYPGSLIKKLWFIPLGLLSIHLINVIRIVALAILVKTNPDLLEFNHTYTFTVIVYGYVFLLWYIWATKYHRAESFKT